MELYSFGRLNPNNAFIGGFVKEGINIGTFKKFLNTKTQVYSLSITDKQYYKITEIIKEFHKQRNIYKFNIIGLLFAGLNIRIARRNKLYCAEFVRYVLYNSDVNIENCPLAIKPEDLKKINNMELIYKGLLKEYRVERIENF